jgi:hypothetical protein
LPDPAAVVAETVLTPNRAGAGVSAAPEAGVATYRILRTTEVDAYDPPTAPEAFPTPEGPTPAPPSDSFQGTARKSTKLSIANAQVEALADVRALINALPPDSAMIARQPRIKTTATSRRVKEEKRNVRVRAFIYAASREDDNDFHLIVGRDPNAGPGLYMTMELSGLPAQGSAAFSRLRAAREAYKQFFGADLPGLTYDFYDPPIPIEVEGSLFFDMSHSAGARPGPQSLRAGMPTIWEIHPITRIVFEP